MHRHLLPALALLATLPFGLDAQGRAQSTRAPMMASVDTNLFRGMRYRLVGPPRGGRVTTVAGVPSQPRTFYMGVASGGLWRTTNGGESWEPLGDGQIKVGSMGSIAVADSDPNIIYVGTGSDGLRSNVSTGRGVYKTTDAGKTWQFVGLYDVGQIGAVRIHPTNPDIVWVAANGDAFKKSAERGIYKTTDGGRTWKKTLFVSDSSGAMDVEIQPGNPSVVYAWMSRIERKPWTIISGSREGGFYKSTNGGETWQRVMTGLPSDLIGKGNLAVSAANPNRIYLLVEAKPGGGVYRSDDAGQTWTQTSSQGSLVQRPFYYTTLGADPTNADVVYAGAEGFFKSVDGGKTFTTLRTPHGDNHDIWINPTNGQTMVQANDGGANVSFDGGRTWSTQMNQPTSEIYGVWLDNEFPYKLYGAQQDNSTIIMPMDANPFDENGFNADGPGCETGPIMPKPDDPNIVYGNCKGQFSRMNMTVGQEQIYWIGGQSLYGNDARDLIYRIQRTSAMDVSPHAPYAVYYGTQYLHRTRDGGVTWEKLSDDLTANDPCCQGASGEPITRDVTGEEFYSTLYAIKESPIEKGVIWVGSNDGPFHVSRDDGKTWAKVTPPDLPPGGRVQFIDASPHRRGSAYYAVYRYLLGDYKPYIYRTDDYGRTWKLLTNGRNGIPADWPTRVVREDPDREGLLYAGTEFGMFVSFDNGDHWQPFGLNLPTVPITDIKVHQKDLVISTQGRAFWILDNVSALHQITPQLQATAMHLYRPRDGYRTRDAQQLLGPMIEYYLSEPPEGGVTLDILDQRGQVVATHTSAAPAAQASAGGPPGGARRGGEEEDPDAMMEGRGRGRGGARAARPTATAGHNRFVWNVQDAQGIALPPGQYQVRLTASGRSQTQPLTVRIDPNVERDGVTVADLREQYEHNVKMRAMVQEMSGIAQRLQNAQQRLRGATGAAADTLARVNAVAAKVFSESVRYGKPGLQTQISYLAGMTTRADQKIGRDVISRHAQLRKELDAIKADVDRAIGPQR